MKLKTNKLSAWLAALAFVVLAPMAQAVPIVTNGEFDTDLSDWSATGTVGTPVYAASENRPGGTGGAAEFGYTDEGLVLKQFIGSLNELQYTFDFYLKAVGVTGFFPDGFEATVGGAADNNGDPVAFGVPLTMVSVGGDWVHYQGMFSGVDEFTLVFSFTTPDSNDDNFTVYLDGVSITQVPEPGSLALVGLALAGIAVLRRRKA